MMSRRLQSRYNRSGLRRHVKPKPEVTEVEDDKDDEEIIKSVTPRQYISYFNVVAFIREEGCANTLEIANHFQTGHKAMLSRLHRIRSLGYVEGWRPQGENHLLWIVTDDGNSWYEQEAERRRVIPILSRDI